MAQKTVLDRLGLGNRTQDDFVKVSYQGSRFRFFWDVFKTSLGKFTTSSLFALLFFLPVIVILVYFYIAKSNFGINYNFNANIGIGYPPSGSNIMQDYKNAVFFADLQMYSLVIPFCMVAFVGLAGFFRVVKVLSWGKMPGLDGQPPLMKEFFAGVSRGFLKFMGFGILAGVSAFVIFVSLSVAKNLEVSGVLSVFAVIGAFLVAIFLMSACMFGCTQVTTFNIGFFRALLNGFAFAGILYINNLLFAILVFLPVLIIFLAFHFLTFLAPILIMLFLFWGIGFIVLAYTLYSHFLYERFLFSKVVRSKESSKKNNANETKTETSETMLSLSSDSNTFSITNTNDSDDDNTENSQTETKNNNNNKSNKPVKYRSKKDKYAPKYKDRDE